MNPEIKSKWLQALRSGQYQQGMAVLRDEDDHFCCLGVLADVYDSGLWISKETCFMHAAFPYAEVSHVSYLSNDLGDKLGLSRDQQYFLSNLNDKAKRSFPEIADYIEENL